MMDKKIIILLFIFIFVFAVTANAQTPDGMTPAEETVCDSLAGASFGLCNAYCEAMDCDSDNPQASEVACEKVRDGFLRIQGTEPPCLVANCTDNSSCESDQYCEKSIGDCSGNGECVINNIFCPEIWQPVCGCNGLTYANECYAAQAGVNIASLGSCLQKPTFP